MASYGSYRTLYNVVGATASPPAVQQNDGTSPRLGGHFVIDVTSGAALAITPTIEALDVVSGKWYQILQGAVLGATGTSVLKVYPGVANTANVSVSDVLPPIWRLTMAHGNANAASYTVTARLFD